MMSAGSVYETAATFGDLCLPKKPVLVLITVPQVKKRRQPTKHYVYKIVVQWSNGNTTMIYRRYSMFFDFLVKLQELYSSLKEKNPKYQGEGAPQIPDIPGKILFGRSQIHQVAEKRRGKIEEFCMALVALPPEISQSNVVLSFFNTWPDDTLHHSSSSSSSENATVSSPVSTTSLTSQVSSSSDLIISHPDEMENLEQYRVIADYKRQNTHQVDLSAGQIIHVIEKQDTGWWMVVTDEEQGYAPAVVLEAVDMTYEDVPELASNEVYVAMENYSPENDDEVGFKAGDKIEVVHKSMDGWWRIKSKGGKTGYCPATLIRKLVEKADQQQQQQQQQQQHKQKQQQPQQQLDVIYESEKSIYEGLNIHRPPPRKNTIKRKNITTGQVTTSPTYSSNPFGHYQIPRPLTSRSSSSSDDDRRDFSTVKSAPFSPDHYEVRPNFHEEDSIYENTEFNTSTSPKDKLFTDPIYQNMETPQQRPQLKKHPMKSKSVDLPEDDDYINPAEFKLGEARSVVKNPHKKLAGSQSLGVVTPAQSKAGDSDEEYIEMDSVYAPVAPNDEPSHIPVTASFNVTPKKPAPYHTRKFPTKQQSDNQIVPSRSAVLAKTKSLEDLLSEMQEKQQGSSPVMQRKGKGFLQLGRNIPSASNSGADQTDGGSPSASNQVTKKPEAARKVAGKNPYHRLNVVGRPASPDLQSKSASNYPNHSPQHNHYTSRPIDSPGGNRSPSHSIAKTYIAIADYKSQADGCLSFNEGDRCVLVSSAGEWWLVNIGGREGWTPAEFWQEQRSTATSFAQPPRMAPARLVQGSKPRSYTVAVDERDSSSETVNENQFRKRGPPPKPKPPSAISSPTSKWSPDSNTNGESPPPPPPPRRMASQGQLNLNGYQRLSPEDDSDYSRLSDAVTSSVDNAIWFQGTMDRDKAEQFLMDNARQREFLVRERAAKRGYYALSIRYHYNVKHFNIDPRDGKYSMGLMQFSSIDEVVRHYQANSLFIQDGQQVSLGQPVRRKSRIDKTIQSS